MAWKSDKFKFGRAPPGLLASHREIAQKPDELRSNDARHKLGWSKAQAMGTVARVCGNDTRTVAVQTISKKPSTRRNQPREEAKGINQRIKASAFKVINKFVDEKFKPKNFDTTLDCIKYVRKFLISHFGPETDDENLENRVKKLTGQNRKMMVDLEIYQHLVKIIMSDGQLAALVAQHEGGPEVSGRLCGIMQGEGIVYESFGRKRVNFGDLLKFAPTEETLKNYRA